MKFFVLQNVPGSSHETDVTPVEPHYKEGLTCPACARPVSGDEWLAPHKAELRAHGKTAGDIIFAAGHDVLVSDRFLRAWRAEKLNGLFGLRDVEITACKPKKALRKAAKYVLALAGFGMTQIDEKKSHVEREGEADCLQCMGGAVVKAVHGFTIDLASWSGEDIFVPWGYAGRLVASERVLALRDKYELTNMNLSPTEAFVFQP